MSKRSHKQDSRPEHHQQRVLRSRALSQGTPSSPSHLVISSVETVEEEGNQQLLEVSSYLNETSGPDQLEYMEQDGIKEDIAEDDQAHPGDQEDDVPPPLVHPDTLARRSPDRGQSSSSGSSHMVKVKVDNGGIAMSVIKSK